MPKIWSEHTLQTSNINSEPFFDTLNTLIHFSIHHPLTCDNTNKKAKKRVHSRGFPWSSSKRIRLWGQSTDGTKVNNVARKLRLEKFLYICANLHVWSSTGSTKVMHTSHFLRKPVLKYNIKTILLHATVQNKSVAQSVTFWCACSWVQTPDMYGRRIFLSSLQLVRWRGVVFKLCFHINIDLTVVSYLIAWR